MQNGFVESFNGRLRDELLNETLFHSLPHVRAVLSSWRRDYNKRRPHSRLGWLAPAKYRSRLGSAGRGRCAAPGSTPWPLDIHPDPRSDQPRTLVTAG
jgi:putative transposase